MKQKTIYIEMDMSYVYYLKEGFLYDIGGVLKLTYFWIFVSGHRNYIIYTRMKQNYTIWL